MKGCYSLDKVIHYFGNPAGYVYNDKVVIDPIFAREDLLEFVDREICKPIEYKQNFHEEICKGIVDEEAEILQRRFKIYQLKSGIPEQVRFYSLSVRLTEGYGKPHREEYDQIYEEEVNEFNLENIWERFSTSVPSGFKGHPLSISDIVELAEGNESRYFFIEPNGYQEISF